MVGKYHEVYIDNYIDIISLRVNLESEVIYCCGTATRDRNGLPKEFSADEY